MIKMIFGLPFEALLVWSCAYTAIPRNRENAVDNLVFEFMMDFGVGGLLVKNTLPFFHGKEKFASYILLLFENLHGGIDGTWVYQ